MSQSLIKSLVKENFEIKNGGRQIRLLSSKKSSEKAVDNRHNDFREKEKPGPKLKLDDIIGNGTDLEVKQEQPDEPYIEYK